MSDSLQPCVLQHTRLPCPSPTPGACWNSCQCCHPTISSSVVPFSSCLQSFPASRSYPVSWLFPSGGQSIGSSTSASILPMNIQGRFPLGSTGLISLQSKGLSRVFSSTIVQKHQLHEQCEKNTGVGCCFLLQGIFPTQESNLSSPTLAGRLFTTEPAGKSTINT